MIADSEGKASVAVIRNEEYQGLIDRDQHDALIDPRNFDVPENARVP